MVLDFLREQFSRTNAKIDALAVSMTEVKERIGILEDQHAGLLGQTAALSAQYANLSRRVDRVASDVELIKRRLDIVPA
jgi:hypothetical protein